MSYLNYLTTRESKEHSNYLILLIKAGTSNLYIIISISLYYSFFLCFSLSETIHLSLSFSIFIYLFTGAPSNWSNPQDWTEEDNCCSQVRNIETSCENFFPSFLSTRNGISFYFPSCISCGLIICGSGSPIFDECGSSPDLGHWYHQVDLITSFKRPKKHIITGWGRHRVAVLELYPKKCWTKGLHLFSNMEKLHIQFVCVWSVWQSK